MRWFNEGRDGGDSEDAEEWDEENFVLLHKTVDAFIKIESRTAVNGNLLSVMSQRKEKVCFSFGFLFKSNYLLLAIL